MKTFMVIMWLGLLGFCVWLTSEMIINRNAIIVNRRMCRKIVVPVEFEK